MDEFNRSLDDYNNTSTTVSNKCEIQDKRHCARRILIVANRLPVSAVRNGDGGWRLDGSVGGLVSGLSGVTEYETRWIGWAGVNVPDHVKRESLTKSFAQKGCVPVFLNEDLVRLYYNGYCNNILWQILHSGELPQEDGIDTLEAQHNAYIEVNHIFANVIEEHYQDGDVVWCHDYHLMLLPICLKEKKQNMKVGWFLHTPFPSSDVFKTIPSPSRLLKAVLAADLVGFHTNNYATNFVSACTQILGLEVTPLGVKDEGRLTRIAVFPIGIDSDKFVRTVQHSEVKQYIKAFEQRFSGRKVILGVDRLDIIKGIPHKLLAYEKFLTNNPDLRDKVVLVQIAVPTRIKVPIYQQLARQVHEIVGRINGRLGTLKSVPIVYLEQSVDFHALCALYAMADVALITSLKDGMNLVSYEFVACQASKKGVLILSKFTGAAESLSAGAVLIDPSDDQDVATSILYALNMSSKEREERHNHNYTHGTTHTSQKWAQSFLRELNDNVAKPRLNQIVSIAASNRKCSLLG